MMQNKDVNGLAIVIRVRDLNGLASGAVFYIDLGYQQRHSVVLK